MPFALALTSSAGQTHLRCCLESERAGKVLPVLPQDILDPFSHVVSGKLLIPEPNRRCKTTTTAKPTQSSALAWVTRVRQGRPG